MSAYNSAFPLLNCKTPNKYRKQSPWITKGLIQSSINKSKLLRNKLRRPTKQNTLKYKSFCQTYNKLLRIAKATYFDEQLKIAKYDMKQTWKIMKKAMNTDVAKTPIPDHFKINNMKVDDKKQIVDKFNNFFATIGSDISDNVPTSNKPFSQYLNHKHNKILFLNPITPQETIKITSKLKNKTSQGHDNISSKLVQQSIEQI
jgi:hypothetical protein